MKRHREDDLPESMSQMSLKPKKRMQRMDALPPIRILQPEPQLPKLILNPEHSQLVLYKSIPTLVTDQEPSVDEEPSVYDKESAMEWE
jgi:hypothetical protein